MSAPATYLDKILDVHRAAAAADTRTEAECRAAAEAADAPRGFRAALAAADGLAVIAEVKRRSPSKGDLFADLTPADLAGQYAAGDATCMSVLTDEQHFGGSAQDLAEARRAVQLPVIRKDFTVSRKDVLDARAMGADCVLLIAAALSDDELADFHGLAHEVGLDALVEIHDEAELERALAVDANLIGVNQRDLVSFAVDTERALRMAPKLPPGVVRVAESGVKGPEDAALLAAAGYHAVLVGESLVTSGDPTAAVHALRTCSS